MIRGPINYKIYSYKICSFFCVEYVLSEIGAEARQYNTHFAQPNRLWHKRFVEYEILSVPYAVACRCGHTDNIFSLTI